MSKKLIDPDVLIIIFARAPILGQVKTRLIPCLGEQGATHLYQLLLDQTLKLVTASPLIKINLCLTPESDTTYFTQRFNLSTKVITKQKGNDLGARMYHAMTQGLVQYKKVILIGTDCPFMTQTDLSEAILALDHYQMVFSPAYDGGYVLVSAVNQLNNVFNSIDWGTAFVMSQTRVQLRQQHLLWHELKTQHDIDIEDDLKQLNNMAVFQDFYHFYDKK
jgi:rSAM/selenodomain-associated transferase 1